jgi:hypothetical protein
MYCPQCGTDSSPGLQYCRACGANLKVIGKAVALSEAIARSDRGPLPKIREMVKSLKVDHVTEEVSHALDHMNSEIARISPKKEESERRPWISFRKHKTPAERREEHISKGVVSLFSGIGMTIFFYYLSAAMVLKLPPHIIAQIPFEIEPVVRMIWLLGLIPTLSGVGHILAGLLIRPHREVPQIKQAQPEQVAFPAMAASSKTVPTSVTEHTTELLEEKSV